MKILQSFAPQTGQSIPLALVLPPLGIHFKDRTLAAQPGHPGLRPPHRSRNRILCS